MYLIKFGVIELKFHLHLPQWHIYWNFVIRKSALWSLLYIAPFNLSIQITEVCKMYDKLQKVTEFLNFLKLDSRQGKNVNFVLFWNDASIMMLSINSYILIAVYFQIVFFENKIFYKDFTEAALFCQNYLNKKLTTLWVCYFFTNFISFASYNYHSIRSTCL